MEKLQGQIKGIDQKSIRKLSAQQRDQLKQQLAKLEILLQQKLKELESLEN